jgi:hypothetical protein
VTQLVNFTAWRWAFLFAAVALLMPAGEAAAADESNLVARPTVAEGWSGVATCMARVQGGAPRHPIEGKISAAAVAQRKTRAAILVSRAGGGLAPPAPACRTPGCIVDHFYGAQRGPRLLRIAVDYGYIAVSGRHGHVDWTASELDELHGALADLPANLSPFRSGGFRDLLLSQRVDGLITTVDGPMRLVAQAGEPGGGIVIGPAWNSLSQPARRAIVLHELAHEFARARAADFNWRREWRSAMDSDAGAARANENIRGYVSRYALNSVEEDFAESVTAYRYIPGAVRGPAPARYAMLKEWMFDGLEYGSARTCDPMAAFSEATLKLTLQQAKDQGEQMSAAHSMGPCADLSSARDCRLRNTFQSAYRSAWRGRQFINQQAADSALESLMRNELFVSRGLDSLVLVLPPSRFAASAELRGIVVPSRRKASQVSGFARRSEESGVNRDDQAAKGLALSLASPIHQ